MKFFFTASSTSLMTYFIGWAIFNDMGCEEWVQDEKLVTAKDGACDTN